MDLYSQHKDLVTKLAQNYYDTPEDIEDACQDVFLKLLQVQDKIPEGKEATPWVHVVASNLLKDKYRVATSRAAMADRLALTEADLTDVSDPSAVMEMEETIGDFISRYSNLPDELAITMHLYVDELMPYKDIAMKLNIPIGTVASRISRAKQLCGIA